VAPRNERPIRTSPSNAFVQQFAVTGDGQRFLVLARRHQPGAKEDDITSYHLV
jgi:hypothetical protein